MERLDIGLWRYSNEYFKAADKLRDNSINHTSIPVYYLYGHSIELAIKSFLINHGYDDHGLRTLGHDIVKSFEIASYLGIREYLNKSNEVEIVIAMIGPYYKSKSFEYIFKGYKTYPSILNMHNSAEDLVVAVKVVVT